ncbi:hypothetical protein F8M41_025520 [Gigaspora margarita]|uniref:Uncharacterized protein n=1 Tax=Gigaspora margarita TaxID=4874 RepID=A0A8H3XJ69_GIGMA|nr:hypothetical protein F8M41_025520 [Gigaspora margarita]
MINDVTPISEEEYPYITKICTPLLVISLVSTSTLFVIFSLIRSYYPNLADRVSFRLTFAALFCDIGYSGHILYGLFWDKSPELSNSSCAYAFVSCWYRDSGRLYNIIWQWVTLFVWVIASILYCAFVVTMVIRKLKSATTNGDHLNSSQVSDYPTLINRTLISSVVRRVMWYPLVPLVVQFFNSFAETYFYVHNGVSFILLLLCDIGLSLQGLLNALVFSQDIAVTRAFEDIKLNWWISNVNSYELNYPHRSHNKAITDEFSMLRKFNDFVELQALNRNKADIITRDIIIDENNGIINSNIINSDISNNNIIKNVITNNNIINNNGINNNFINDSNNNNSTNYRVINSTNNSLVLQPSFSEWLKYMLLIKLFSVPENTSQLISPKILSQVDSYAGNKPNTLSVLSGKDDSKQDINLDNQNDNQNFHLIPPEPIHLKDSSSADLLSNCLNSPSLSDPLIGSSKSNQANQINQANQDNINNPTNIHNPLYHTTNVIDRQNCTGDDDGHINVMLGNGEPTISSQESETVKQMLKKL